MVVQQSTMFVHPVCCLIWNFSCFSQTPSFFFFMDWNSVCSVPSPSSTLRAYFIWTNNTQFCLQGAVNDRIENFISAHVYWELATFFFFCLKNSVFRYKCCVEPYFSLEAAFQSLSATVKGEGNCSRLCIYNCTFEVLFCTFTIILVLF